MTDTLHVLMAGSQPYNLILYSLTTSDKLGIPFKTKDEHSGNVTALLTNDKQDFILSAGMDSAIKMWSLQNNRK